jgi:simple sugar transport system permease protein
MDVAFFVALMSLAIIKAAPLVYGALCGLLNERSGVVNIGIEGMMLIGAFMAFLGSALVGQWTGGALNPNISLIVGLLIGVLSAALVAGLHAVLSIHYKIDQVISGTVINLLAVGITNYVANVYIDPTHLSGVGVFPVWEIPILSKIPILGPILFKHQPMIYLLFLLVIFLQYAVFNTPWGLRLRSVGEHPQAADSVGIHVNKTRYLNVILGGALAGLGGAIMVLESVGRFQKMMTSGRGFIALAVLIFGRWSPVGAFAAAILFGFSEALGVRLQFGDINHLYALTVIAALAAMLTSFVWLVKKMGARKKQGKSFLAIAAVFGLGLLILFVANRVEFPRVSVPIEFLGLLPYVLTIFVLTGLVKKAVGPAAVGQPYEKQ